MESIKVNGKYDENDENDDNTETVRIQQAFNKRSLSVSYERRSRIASITHCTANGRSIRFFISSFSHFVAIIWHDVCIVRTEKP